MSLATAASRPWSPRRWWGLVLLVFIVQLGLIFWLGERSLVRAPAPATGLVLRFADSDSEALLALRDPTLFVLPHSPTDARPAALADHRPAVPALAWPEPTTLPPPTLDQPGAAFTRFVASNVFDSVRPPAPPAPIPVLPALPPQPLQVRQSAVRLEGELAQRRLVTPLDLPSQTNRDILRDSVVRLLVGADGVPRSLTLLSGSGSAEADQYALDQARGARFQPLASATTRLAPDALGNLSRGQMVFLWRTVFLPATNAPPADP
jgi:hypothetical protein